MNDMVARRRSSLEQKLSVVLSLQRSADGREGLPLFRQQTVVLHNHDVANHPITLFVTHAHTRVSNQ